MKINRIMVTILVLVTITLNAQAMKSNKEQWASQLYKQQDILLNFTQCPQCSKEIQAIEYSKMYPLQFENTDKFITLKGDITHTDLTECKGVFLWSYDPILKQKAPLQNHIVKSVNKHEYRFVQKQKMIENENEQDDNELISGFDFLDTITSADIQKYISIKYLEDGKKIKYIDMPDKLKQMHEIEFAYGVTYYASSSNKPENAIIITQPLKKNERCWAIFGVQPCELLCCLNTIKDMSSLDEQMCTNKEGTMVCSYDGQARKLVIYSVLSNVSGFKITAKANDKFGNVFLKFRN